MSRTIRFSEIEEAADPVSFNGDSSAPRLAEPTVTLRYRLLTIDQDSLEALRYARRAMLREEWTRGLDEDEPSLEEAVFTAFEVSWSVPASAVGVSRSKLAELVERANRVRVELPVGK
jgi:hypothetical protein